MSQADLPTAGKPAELVVELADCGRLLTRLVPTNRDASEADKKPAWQRNLIKLTLS